MATLKIQGNVVGFDPKVLERVKVNLQFGNDGMMELMVLDGTDTIVLGLQLSYNELLAIYNDTKRLAGILP